MPLSRARNRERMRQKRCATCVQPKTLVVVQPSLSSATYVQPSNSGKQAKLAELRALIAHSSTSGQAKPKIQSHEDIPIYNPSIHRAGDRVRVWWNGKFVVKTIPSLDAEGNPY